MKVCSGTISGMTSSPNLDQMPPEQLRALAEPAMQLLSQLDATGKKIHRLETSVEMATLLSKKNSHIRNDL